MPRIFTPSFTTPRPLLRWDPPLSVVALSLIIRIKGLPSFDDGNWNHLLVGETSQVGRGCDLVRRIFPRYRTGTHAFDHNFWLTVPHSCVRVCHCSLPDCHYPRFEGRGQPCRGGFRVHFRPKPWAARCREHDYRRFVGVGSRHAGTLHDR